MNVHSLEVWLDIATRDLCDAARRRVRAEMEQHFLSAKETGTRQGMDDSSAIAHAIEGLGQAERARRRLNREYLTSRQLGLIGGVTETWNMKLRLLFLGVYAIGLAYFVDLVVTSSTRFDVWKAFGQFLSTFIFGGLALRAFFGHRFPLLAIAFTGLAFPLGMTGIVIKWTANNAQRGKSFYNAPVALLISIAAVVLAMAILYEVSTVLIKLRRKHNRDIAGI